MMKAMKFTPQNNVGIHILCTLEVASIDSPGVCGPQLKNLCSGEKSHH